MEKFPVAERDKRLRSPRIEIPDRVRNNHSRTAHGQFRAPFSSVSLFSFAASLFCFCGLHSSFRSRERKKRLANSGL